ncbi:hypothetical protein, partial [Phyllobacterium salinisoli]|uniref:hypothetical protein n=1 Tax=Phyllobacterium salinisoli TaxID=1899321 RepID=UPI001AEC9267
WQQGADLADEIGRRNQPASLKGSRKTPASAGPNLGGTSQNRWMKVHWQVISLTSFGSDALTFAAEDSGPKPAAGQQPLHLFS